MVNDRAAAQSYRIRVQNDGGRRVITVRGADAAGAMYGGLDVAEAIRTGTLDALRDSDHKPHIAQRGIKFNLPLDLRTPSYTDCSDAGQANIPEMWEREFWTAFLDSMARHPKASSPHLFRALQGASQVMPLTTRFFWGDIDLKWHPEACWSHRRSKGNGFYTVCHFMEGTSMPGGEVLNIRDWRTRLDKRQSMTETTPIEIAQDRSGWCGADR